jgi:serine/threonine protein kinase
MNDFYFKQCGAIGYMAPESLSKKNLGSDGISLDSSCDMYSVGVIFYILLMGQSPWKNKNQSVYEQNLEGKICFDFLEEKFRDLGKGEILNAVKGMLEKDPTKRLTAEQILMSRVFTDPLYTESTLQLSSEFSLPPIDLIDPRNPKMNNSNFKPPFTSRKNSIV